MKHSLCFCLMLFWGLSAAAREVTLTCKDGVFTPNTIEMTAGEKIDLMVQNEGKTAEEFESIELNREKVIPPGRTIKIKIGPLAPGTYGFYGEFHSDTAKGKIVVK